MNNAAGQFNSKLRPGDKKDLCLRGNGIAPGAFLQQRRADLESPVA